MTYQRRNGINRIITLTFLLLGVILTSLSAFYESTTLAIIGVAIVFWGLVLRYVTPEKDVPIKLLLAANLPPTSNVEKILTELNLTEKGRYLPPKYLKDFESSIVFIPQTPQQPLPKPDEISKHNLFAESRHGILLVPPGMALAKSFEEEIRKSFAETDLNYFVKNFPNVIVNDLEIAESVEIENKDNKIILEIVGSLLDEVCHETKKLPRTHKSVGCLLSSSIACVLAKVTGKSVVIEKEEHVSGEKKVRIEYLIEGD